MIASNTATVTAPVSKIKYQVTMVTHIETRAPCKSFVICLQHLVSTMSTISRGLTRKSKIKL